MTKTRMLFMSWRGSNYFCGEGRALCSPRLLRCDPTTCRNIKNGSSARQRRTPGSVFLPYHRSVPFRTPSDGTKDAWPLSVDVAYTPLAKQAQAPQSPRLDPHSRIDPLSPCYQKMPFCSYFCQLARTVTISFFYFRVVLLLNPSPLPVAAVLTKSIDIHTRAKPWERFSNWAETVFRGGILCKRTLDSLFDRQSHCRGTNTSRSLAASWVTRQLPCHSHSSGLPCTLPWCGTIWRWRLFSWLTQAFRGSKWMIFATQTSEPLPR